MLQVVRDSAASLLIIAYQLPAARSFAALMLAEGQGAARVVTFLLIVVMSDTGGYVAGVLFGKHPMVPKISPEVMGGSGGSLVFGAAAGVCMAFSFFMFRSGSESFSASAWSLLGPAVT